MATDNTNDNIVQPNPDTGDIIGAMQAQQANWTALYQLQMVQNQSLESLSALQEFANDQLRQQTHTLSNIYQYLTRRFGAAVTQHGTNTNNPVSNPQRNQQLDFQNLSEVNLDAQEAYIEVQNAQQMDVQASTVNISGAGLGSLGQSDLNPPEPPETPIPDTAYNDHIISDITVQYDMLSNMIRDSGRERSAVDRYVEELNVNFRKQTAQMSDVLRELNNQEINLGMGWEQAQSTFHMDGMDQATFEHLQNNIADNIRDAFNVGLSNEELDQVRNLDFEQAQQQFDLGDLTEDSFHTLQESLNSVSDNLKEAITFITGTPVQAATPLDDLAQDSLASYNQVTQISDFLKSSLGEGNWGSGRGAISSVGGMIGPAVGDLAGAASSEALTAVLTPALGPIAPVVGQVGGEIIGKQLEKTIGAAFDALGELWENLENQGRKTRDAIIDAGFDKIRQDVKAMGTYSVEVYSNAVQQIYSSWDKNLSTVTATMGYTKEAVNTLQDSVAQRLEDLGYGQAINAADYLDELGSVLNANLNGKLAEIFTTQSLILEKAVPEINMTDMAAQFAAIYTNAERQGMSGEEVMTEAMNQIAGAVKSIEQTTDGNNQFISQVSAYLGKAQEIVAIAGGSADTVASLTTQMMAAEGPIASLAPQLSGFTGQIVDILTNQNDSTAVALRAIMHDINSDIGISATDFMNSFMEDTKGTLVTAFEAIDQFIEKNEDPGARQEFLQAMESLFGIQGEQLAQLDFSYIGEQLAQTNAHMNTAALLDAEALIKDGEAATLEEQLVNNTANMLLAQNAVRDTLDNNIMRTLEKNELNMEKLVYEQAATQSVDLAENTMGFFTKIKDIIVNLLDPFGLFKAANSAISSEISAAMNATNYAMVANLSSIGSDVADDLAGTAKTISNTVGGAAAAISAAQLTDGNTLAIQAAMDMAGTAGSTQSMIARHALASMSNQQAAAETALASQAEANIGNYENTVEAQQKQQEKAQREAEQQRLREEAAAENQAMATESMQRDQDNHDNLASVSSDVPLIREEIINSRQIYLTEGERATSDINNNIDEFTEAYITGTNRIRDQLAELQENGVRTIVSAIYDAQPDVSGLRDIHEGVERVITLFSTYLEFLDSSLMSSTGSGLQMSYSDRAQILGRGLLT